MAREKYQTLTQPMFFILMALASECCGADVVSRVNKITQGSINIGPGTLYALLGDFVKEGLIEETYTEGRRRNYIITEKGKDLLTGEYKRIRQQVEFYRKFYEED